MKYKQPIVIAELCCNHAGDMETAKRMIRMAEICGVDVCKLQKRDIESQWSLHPHMYDSPHPNPPNAFGKTYREHREFLEFDVTQHRRLKQYIEQYGMEYSTSVWDIVSALQIIDIDPLFIKVPSAHNTDYPLLDILKKKYTGDIHVSLGMTTEQEREELQIYWEDSMDRIVLYHCTSGYPVYAPDAYLLEIERLTKIPCKAIGFSNHHPDINLDFEAQALGASWFEHHVTLDRFAKGTDHSAALEFEALRNLVRGLREGYEALKYKPVEMCQLEWEQRKKLKE